MSEEVEEFVKEQEEMMAEVKEINERQDKILKEQEQERQDGLKEMNESIEEHKKIAEEIKQETQDGLAEMQNSPKEDTIKNKKEQNSTSEKGKVNPPMNKPNTTIAVGQKEDITKRKNAVKYLTDAKESITKTLNYNGKLKWTKEEIALMRKVRAISKELETITNNLRVSIELQEGLTEIQQQLVRQPVANVKVGVTEKGEFAIIKANTEEIMTTGNKEKVKGFLDAIYITQATAPKTE